MPLTLVTGPANAEKAGYVLDRYRAAVDEGALLVVPTFADVERFRRELAERGVVLGVRVLTFSWLMREIGRRAGAGGRALGALARERVAAAAIARTRLEELEASARTPGFVAAFLRLADELGELRVEPGRFYTALRAWAAAEPERARYAEELASLYAAYRDALRGLGRPDVASQRAGALDALRTAPARWGTAPVLLYGFDDLSPLQRDAVETLARHAGADVTVSLTYEPGRVAFAGRGETFQELLAQGARHVELPARAEHYAPAARAALHHLERSLFESGEAGRAASDVTDAGSTDGGPSDGEARRAAALRVDAGGIEGGPGDGEARLAAALRVDAGVAVALLEGGDERAELELVAARVAGLVRDEGFAAEDIAVVLRRPRDAVALLEQVFAAYGLQLALERWVPVGHTAVGRGLLGLLRTALLDGTADDLLAWLRTPGKLRIPGLADRLEARARRAGAASAARARELWERDSPGFPLVEIDRLAEAAARGPTALHERLAAEASALFAAPWRGAAPVLTGADALEARAAGELRSALRDLTALAEQDRALAPGPEELARLLDGLQVRAGEPPRTGAVTVASPLAVRARRVRALFLCGLQEGVFPAPARPEPFLGDAERRAINAASGLRLRLHEDPLAAERYLFYAAVSRPTDRLALSWHAADADGDPVVPSLFVADVRDVLGEDLWAGRERRALGAAGWPAAAAPTERERLRAEALAAPGPGAPIAPLNDPAVLRALRERRTWSASALETWAGCPVKWFVERFLSPDPLEPDPEPLVRGALAHRVLEEAFRALRAGGDGRVTRDCLPEVKRLVHEALRRHAGSHPPSVNPERLRASLRRLEADLLGYVERAAALGSAFAPEHFELCFGGTDDEHPPVVLAGGELALAGRVDRVDVEPGGERAIVYDYKGKSAPKQAGWVAGRRLQMGLYMLAVGRLLGVEVVGGLYQPLGGGDPRPRGLLRDDADPGLDAVGTDRLEDEAFDAVLAEVEQVAVRALAEARAGALEPQPESCAYRGGCAYPSICRCEP